MFAITCTLIGIIYYTLISRLIKSEDKLELLMPRVQKLEDIDGIHIADLIRRVEKVEKTLEEVKSEVHVNKNTSNAMSTTLTSLNNWLILEKDKSMQK